VLDFTVLVHTTVLWWSRRLIDRLLPVDHSDLGQSTAEYALVLLGAAAVALMLAAWATKTDKIGKLLDGVLDRVLSHVP